MLSRSGLIHSSPSLLARNATQETHGDPHAQETQSYSHVLETQIAAHAALIDAQLQRHSTSSADDEAEDLRRRVSQVINLNIGYYFVLLMCY